MYSILSQLPLKEVLLFKLYALDNSLSTSPYAFERANKAVNYYGSASLGYKITCF
jgi:hypothetical protein